MRCSAFMLCVILSACGVGAAGAEDNGPMVISVGDLPGQVGRYEKVEMLIKVGREYSNPFDPCEVELSLLVTEPNNRPLVLPAFWGQDYERKDVVQDGKTVAWCYPQGAGSWKARFAPAKLGTYVLRASLKDRQGEIASSPATLECIASSSKGFLRAGRDDPRFFEFSEGQSFFAIGQNLAFIGEGQYVTVPKAEEIFGKLARNGANFLRIWTCCDDWALAIESRKSAWGRSWATESPIVAMPGRESGEGSRKCVQLNGGDGASISPTPSHPVALRPGTQYVLSGRVKMDGPKALHIEADGKSIEISSAQTGPTDWQPFELPFTTGDNANWLGRIAFTLLGSGAAWLDAISLKEAAGGPELLWEADVNRPVRGYYNPLDCFMLDQIVEGARRNGIYLMLCAITRDLYMSSLSTPGSPEYRKAVNDAKKFMRYAVARWGYSTSVAAWEYFNEMDPGKPTDEFYAQVGRYLERIDVYRHPRTTSTWSPSAKDCRHPQIDIAQEHHYMRPDDDDFKDEVESIARQSRWLREQAPNKPALIGEFGLATAKWGLSEYMKQDREGVHFHNCLWASALGGCSGTAMFWWWESLDQQNAYRHYKPLAAFLADMRPAGLQPTIATTSEPRIRIVGQQGEDRAYLWLFDRQATWWSLVVEKHQPALIDSATITLDGLKPGRYTVLWWDTKEGIPAGRQNVAAEAGRLELTAPPFTRDLACKVVPATFAE
ncbi:MAG: DUF5060 domain-containing protein [Phycisphaerales bacterium]